MKGRRRFVAGVVVALCCLVVVPLSARGKQEAGSEGAGATVAGSRAASGFQEAPMLAERVVAGKLPPLEQRMPAPDEVFVLEPLDEIGRYGGTLKRLDLAGVSGKPDRDIGDGLFEFSPDGSGDLVANLVKSYEVGPEGKEFTFHLRKGIKWSDGEEYTTDDIQWYWEHVMLNKDLTPAPWGNLQAGGEVAKLAVLDEYSFTLSFSVPNPLFLKKLGSVTLFSRYPSQYLEQFHVSFVDKDKLAQITKEAGFENWYQLFQNKANQHTNPEIPTLYAYKLVTETTGQLVIYERNPYYWKVDPAGQQLPYIDRWEYVEVEDRETMQLKAIAGECDLMIHWLEFDKWPVALKEAEKNNYRVINLPFPINGAGRAIFFHFGNVDTEMTDFFKKRDFRIAVSLAIDRDEINQIAYSGLNTTKQGVVNETHPAYDEELAYQYTEHDPAKASELLDEIGLDKKDKDGFRLMPSGRRLELIMNCPVQSVDHGEMMARHLAEVGLYAAVKGGEYATFYTKMMNGEYALSIGSVDGGDMPVITGWSFFPISLKADRWAAPYSTWYYTNGERGTKPEDPGMLRLMEIYDAASATLDEAQRIALVKEAMRLHVDNLWHIGVVQYAPLPGLVKNYVKNVPDVIQYSANFPHGRYVRPEQFWLDK